VRITSKILLARSQVHATHRTQGRERVLLESSLHIAELLVHMHQRISRMSRASTMLQMVALFMCG
tara:strand:- start:16 stop:210 length:195 start_codon:yes stop_codon:yes gene_type:complete